MPWFRVVCSVASAFEPGAGHGSVIVPRGVRSCTVVTTGGRGELVGALARARVVGVFAAALTALAFGERRSDISSLRAQVERVLNDVVSIWKHHAAKNARMQQRAITVETVAELLTTRPLQRIERPLLYAPRPTSIRVFS